MVIESLGINELRIASGGIVTHGLRLGDEMIVADYETIGVTALGFLHLDKDAVHYVTVVAV